ncbi:MAG: DUF167 domain-containing protein [Gemmataceae bacterium]
MIAEREGGVVLSVRAQPNARKTGVLGERAGALRLAVAAPPDGGRANAALIELVRELFDLKRSQVELLAGATARDKAILLRGVTAAEARLKLAVVLKG